MTEAEKAMQVILIVFFTWTEKRVALGPLKDP